MVDKISKKTLEKLPPHDIEAEQSVLGAVLIDNEALYKALEVLRPDDFYHSAHRKIFDCMIALSERREMIDLLTLKSELERHGKLEEVGGPPYIAALVDVVPTAANVEFHARIVHEKAIARRLLNASIQITTRCYADVEEVDRLLEDAERLIFEISETRVREGFSPLKEVIKESFKTIEGLYDKKGFITGIPTGFIDLDRLTSGFQPSDLIIVAARPSMGKSSFCLNIAQHVGVREQLPTAIFSLEMSKEQLGIRLLCAEARVDSHRVRTGYVAREDWPRLSAAAEILSTAPIFIDDTPAISVLEMRAKSRRLRAEHGLGLIIVDYLQLMRSPKRHENRQQEITEISRSLKALAKELNVPVVALSQLSRAVETRSDRKPQLSDLRESGCLTGDTVITRTDTGKQVTLEELHRRGERTLPILTLNERLRLEKGIITNVFESGVKRVYRLTTRSGRRIKASANHPFRALTAWKRLHELKVGERIAVPAEYEVGGDIYWDRVVSIEDLAEAPVFDATVAGTHNFIANDIVVHNSLEQDADVVIFIYRPDAYDPDEQPGIAEIMIGKQRNGPVGTVQLAFIKEYTRFENLETSHRNEGQPF